MPLADPARILVVDDHRPTRQSLCLLLRDVGYDCTSAASVADARTALLASPTTNDTTPPPAPALIIADLWMPHEDGEALLRWVRTQPHLAKTRVVIYSAAPESDHADRLRRAGADDFLPKPLPIPRLLARLADFTQPVPVPNVETLAGR